MQIQPVAFSEAASEIMGLFSSNKGVFLTTGSEKPNAMIISWGGISFIWGEQIFQTVVRLSRHSYQLLKELGEFTVSVPKFPLDDLAEAYKICGSKSGRELDKFAQCGLIAQQAQTVSVPVIGQCAMHLECKVVYASSIEPYALGADEMKYAYKNGDLHTTFYGKILACYKTNTGPHAYAPGPYRG